MVLEGTDEYQDRSKLFESLVDLIATESPTYNIQCEVEMISAIQTFKRKHHETPEVFENLYKISISLYINQSTLSHRGDDQQWAVMILRNAIITPDMLNAITFQLTAASSIAKQQDHSITLDYLMVNSFLSTLINLAGDRCAQNINSVLDRIRI